MNSAGITGLKGPEDSSKIYKHIFATSKVEMLTCINEFKTAV